MLETLDWEIRTATDEGKAIGTSIWSLTLALGAVLWFLSKESTYSWRDLPPLIHLVIGFSLIYDFLSGLYFTAGPKLPEQQPKRVTSASDMLSPQRRVLVFDLLRRLTLAVIAISGFDPLLSGATKWIVFLWFGPVVLIYLLGLAISALPLEAKPDKEPTPRQKTFKTWISAFGWVSPLLVASAFWIPLVAHGQTFNASDYRCAALVVVATFLIHLLLGSLQRSALLPFLISLRRDLALGVISAADASSRARLSLSGLTVDEFIRKEFAAHKTLMTMAYDTFVKINSFLGVIENDLQARPERDPEQYLPQYEGLVGSGSRLDNNHTHFLGKLEALPEGPARDALRAEADDLITAIRDSRAEATTRIAKIRQARAASASSQSGQAASRAATSAHPSAP